MVTLFPSRKKGFTLVELIVSITIFSVLIAVGVGSYLNLSATLKKQNIQRKLYSEIAQVLEDIHRWGKYYTIDYASYENPLILEGTDKLILVSKDGLSRISVQKISTEDKDSLGIYKERKDENGIFVPDEGYTLNTYQPLLSKNTTVQDIRFFIFPLHEYDSFQPKVTIVIHGSLFNPFAAKDELFDLQTTFSIRSYVAG